MSAPVYRADPSEARRQMALDSLSLIYHRTSGITHIVADPVPQIMDALDAGPANAAEIVRRLSARHRLDAREAEPVIAARLTELETAGLVFRA